MSVIDIAFALLTLLVCYIGYFAARTENLAFLLGLLASSIVMYFFFPAFDEAIKRLGLISPEYLASSVAVALLVIPTVLLGRFLFGRAFGTLGLQRLVLVSAFPFFSRVIGVMLGFAVSYFCMASILMLAVRIQKPISGPSSIPEVLRHSAFFRLVTKDSSTGTQTHSPRIDNLPVLMFLYDKENLTNHGLTETELDAIARIIRGINTQHVKELLQMKASGTSNADIYRKLFALYIGSVSEIEDEYKVDINLVEPMMIKLNHEEGNNLL